MTKSVEQCLASLGVAVEDLTDCANLQAEFDCIKKAHREAVLAAHPDKGGDPAVFREVRASFEVLRDMFSHKEVDSFAKSISKPAEFYEQTYADFADMPTPSYEFYTEAAEEDIPLYRMELAKSARSKCTQKGKTAKKCQDEQIKKDELRIGVFNDENGSYWQWKHLQCWRVPSRLWLGLPDPEECDDPEQFAAVLRSLNDVLLSGYEELPEEVQQNIVQHVMDKDNWAKLIKRKEKTAVAVSTEQATTDVVREGHHAPRQAFIIPKPGVDGAQPNCFAGKTFVITGTFPEIGGSKGLNLGKDRLKNMIETFGGRVTSSISGRTDVLVVGKDPGMSKVTKARAKPKIQLVNLKDLKECGIEAGRLEDANPVVIQRFSAGFGNNGLALGASAEELAIAAGMAAPQLTADKKRAALEDSKPPAKKRKGTKKAPPAQDKKTTKKVKKEKKSSVVEGVYDITCDGCGVNCSAQSWFVEEEGTDWCDACKTSKGKEGAVLQKDGIAVAK